MEKKQFYRCWKCGTELERIARNRQDLLIEYFTGSLLGWKRYYCFCCLKGTLLPTRLLRSQKKEAIR